MVLTLRSSVKSEIRALSRPATASSEQVIEPLRRAAAGRELGHRLPSPSTGVMDVRFARLHQRWPSTWSAAVDQRKERRVDAARRDLEGDEGAAEGGEPAGACGCRSAARSARGPRTPPWRPASPLPTSTAQERVDARVERRSRCRHRRSCRHQSRGLADQPTRHGPSPRSADRAKTSRWPAAKAADRTRSISTIVSSASREDLAGVRIGVGHPRVEDPGRG